MIKTEVLYFVFQKKEKKESDIQPSMVTHTRNSCSTFTHPSAHTHPKEWAAIYAAAPREQLGVLCLAQGHLVVVLNVERVLYIHSPPTYNPSGTEIWTRNLSIMSPILEPLGHDFPVELVLLINTGKTYIYI